MRAGVVLFYLTAIMIFFQLFMGGMVVFGFVPYYVHIITGYVTLGFAASTMAAAMVSKPSFRPVKIQGVLLLAMVVLQGLLGFIILGGANNLLILVHFTNALLIYGLAVSGVSFARRWGAMPLTESQGRVGLAIAVAVVVVAILWYIGYTYR